MSAWTQFSRSASLRQWRDAVFTTAAFALVLAAVVGVGPFEAPGSPTSGGAARGIVEASATGSGPLASRLADLSE